MRAVRRGPGRAALRAAVADVPLWWRAPLLLFGSPALLLAVAAGALVLSVAAATPSLFLSSAGGVEVAEGLAHLRPGQAGLTVQSFGSLGSGDAGAGLVEVQDRAVALVAASLRGVGSPSFTILGSQVDVSGPAGPAVRVQTLFRTGFERHVRLIAGSGERDGVWLDGDTAEGLGVEPGDTVRLSNSEGSVEVPVAATYRSLAAGALPPFWAGLEDFVGTGRSGGQAPPPVLLAGEGLLRSAGRGLRMTVRLTWELPLLDRTPTIEDARSDAAAFDAATARLGTPSDGGPAPFGRGAVVSKLPGVVAAAERSVDGIAGAVNVVSLAGRFLALGLLAAAAAAEARRRRREIRLLDTLGDGPGHMAVAACLEVLLPFVVAAYAGVALATWLVDRLGPGGAIGSAAGTSAMWQAAAWMAGALPVVGVATAIVARRTAEDPADGRLREALSGAPWEILVLLLAGAALFEVVTRGGLRTNGEAVRVDAFALVFPLLFVAGMAGLGARAARRLLPALGGVGPGRSTARYLAARRLAAASAPALALGAMVAAAASALLFAGIVSTSARTSTDEKIRDAAGADVRVRVAEGDRIPASLGFPHTEVWRVTGASVLPTGPRVTVLAIDRGTFAGAAAWSGAFSGGGPADAVAPLAGRSTRLPVVVAGAGLSGDVTLEIGSRPVPATVRATLGGFPGRTSTVPVVVASRAELETALGRAGSSLHGAGGQRELWVRGDPPAILAALRRAGVTLAGPVHRPDQAAGVSAARAVGWVFGLLQALGGVAVVATLAGLVLYLRTGRRGRDAGHAVAVRMGLRRGSHVRALVLELGAILGAALVVGAVLAGVAAWVVFRQFELLPTVPPPAGLHVPWVLVGAMALGAAATALAGGWLVQRAVDRVRVVEVQRRAA